MMPCESKCGQAASWNGYLRRDRSSSQTFTSELKVTLVKIPKSASNNSKPIFISHAATDKAIADRVVDLLNTAMGIDVQNDVFCTSLEGLKIPPGKDFKDFVKD